MSVATMKCLAPQFISGAATGRTVMVPCGQCYYCKRKISRRWVGKAMSETLYPVNIGQTDLHMVHKFDLTYAETPMTTPVPHNLGEVFKDGKLYPFAGPWANNKFPDRRIEINDQGKPYYTKNGKPLNAHDLAWEHRLSLIQRNGWDHARVEDWINGTYDPVMTTSVKDIQRFLDRLRKTLIRKHPQHLPIRYLTGTEYGGVTGRPHAHCIIWGLHPDNVELVHDKWEGYQRGAATNGHVHPSRRDCVLNRASIVTGGAESYSVKDVPKARHLNVGNPAILEQETPRVFGSKHPPIGEGAFLPWMEEHIKPGLQRAERAITGTPGEREVLMCVALRKIYSQLPVRLTPDKYGRPRQEVFPTTNRWRDKCREILNIPDQVWEAATVLLETNSADQTEIIQHNVEGLGDDHKQHIDQLRKRRDEILERQERATSEKRARLLAAGKLQPSRRG